MFKSGSRGVKYFEINTASKRFYQKKKGICRNYSEEKKTFIASTTTKSIKHQVESYLNHSAVAVFTVNDTRCHFCS